MRLRTRWSGLVCAARLALLIVIRYCSIEVLLEVIVLSASYFHKGLCFKKAHLLCDRAGSTGESQQSQRRKKRVNVSAISLLVKNYLKLI